MNPDPQHYYLMGAYLAAWVIHGAYLGILVLKYKKIRQEMGKLKGSS